MERKSGGYQAIATLLTERSQYPWSRQQVFMWWSRRVHNGFPEGEERPAKSRTADDNTVREFPVEDVVEWFDLNYPETRLERLRWLKRARMERRATESLSEKTPLSASENT